MTDPRAGIDPKTVPAEIDRWNWGAFLLNWIWGVGNNTFIALLAIVPFFGVIMMFVLGARGSGWAWRNGRWDSIDHFKRVQRAWAIWGVVVWLGSIALLGGFMGSIFYMLSHSEAYRLGAARLQASTEAANALGTPISTGFAMGSVSTSGAGGRAALSFSASGPKATGHVFLEAVRKDGVWSLTRLTLKVDGRDVLIDLMRKFRAGSDGWQWRAAAAQAVLID
ncbi:MAG: cytochrome c oxidase assembly factor Coa1 family protein [Xanthobacteraceae bacterium]